MWNPPQPCSMASVCRPPEAVHHHGNTAALQAADPLSSLNVVVLPMGVRGTYGISATPRSLGRLAVLRRTPGCCILRTVYRFAAEPPILGSLPAP